MGVWDQSWKQRQIPGNINPCMWHQEGITDRSRVPGLCKGLSAFQLPASKLTAEVASFIFARVLIIVSQTMCWRCVLCGFFSFTARWLCAGLFSLSLSLPGHCQGAHPLPLALLFTPSCQPHGQRHLMLWGSAVSSCCCFYKVAPHKNIRILQMNGFIPGNSDRFFLPICCPICSFWNDSFHPRKNKKAKGTVGVPTSDFSKRL